MRQNRSTKRPYIWRECGRWRNNIIPIRRRRQRRPCWLNLRRSARFRRLGSSISWLCVSKFRVLMCGMILDSASAALNELVAPRKGSVVASRLRHRPRPKVRPPNGPCFLCGGGFPAHDAPLVRRRSVWRGKFWRTSAQWPASQPNVSDVHRTLRRIQRHSHLCCLCWGPSTTHNGRTWAPQRNSQRQRTEGDGRRVFIT